MVYIYAFLGRLLLYPYLSYRAAHLFSVRGSRLFNILLLTELILSTSSLAVHRFVMHPLMSKAMDVNLYIFFGLGYIGAFLISINLFEKIASIVGLSPKQLLGQKGRKVLDWSVVVTSTLLFIIVLLLGYSSGHSIQVIDYTAPHQTNRELLARVVLVTDLHIGEGGRIEHVRRVVSKVNSLQPDVILFGGDYIDHDPKYAYQKDVIEEMKKLKARDGIFFVPGNHEYRTDTLANFEWVSRIGATLLLDSIAYPRDSAYSIVGRRDYVDYDRKPLDVLLQELNPREYNILLEHTPEGLELLEGTSLDYALYGHTHAGQLWPYIYALHLKYVLPYGQANFGGTTAIVSSGVGAAGTLFRIGTRSEVVLLDLYRK